MTHATNPSQGLRQAIYEALVVSAEVVMGIEASIDGGHFPPDTARWARQSLIDLKRGLIFGPVAIDQFQCFADDLSVLIGKETSHGWVVDENNMAGGHEETHVTDTGQVLSALYSVVKRLTAQLQRVEFLQTSEQITEELLA